MTYNVFGGTLNLAQSSIIVSLQFVLGLLALYCSPPNTWLVSAVCHRSSARCAWTVSFFFPRNKFQLFIAVFSPTSSFWTNPSKRCPVSIAVTCDVLFSSSFYFCRSLNSCVVYLLPSLIGRWWLFCMPDEMFLLRLSPSKCHQVNGKAIFLHQNVTALFWLSLRCHNVGELAWTRRVIFSMFSFLFLIFHSLGHTYLKLTSVSSHFYFNTHSCTFHTLAFLSVCTSVVTHTLLCCFHVSIFCGRDHSSSYGSSSI